MLVRFCRRRAFALRRFLACDERGGDASLEFELESEFLESEYASELERVVGELESFFEVSDDTDFEPESASESDSDAE